MAEGEWRHTLRTRTADLPWQLGVNAVVVQQRPESGAMTATGRFNELHLSTDVGNWNLSVGKKIVGWDVGYGFRPNDVVQQEARRTLAGITPGGRPLLQADAFGSDTAWSFVWVNPQHHSVGAANQQGAQESALAARGYWRVGALDAHTFGRVGEHTRASLGAAIAWVAGDEVELHGSLRAMQRRDGWSYVGTSPTAPLDANPWRQTTRGGAKQALIGMNWTGTQQRSVMVEAWHDGTALSNAEWRRWCVRNQALGASPAPVIVRAGNLAWQASPLDAPNLRRDNVFVRLGWQPGVWTFTFDALITPADRGRVLTTGVQWQGDRVRLNVSWRDYGGPAEAVYAQLPYRHNGLLNVTWAF